jgi:sugar fermentation stimulation protein A
LLEDPRRGACYVEVKCTTYAQDESALFPDAVTERGTKHLGELARLARRGTRAVQFFFVSRGDSRSFRPADAIDPVYGRALRRAVRAGVEVLAHGARVEPCRLELGPALAVVLEVNTPARPRGESKTVRAP